MIGEQIVIKSKFAFSKIKFISFESAEKDMYYTLHEADISKFVDIADEKKSINIPMEIVYFTHFKFFLLALHF